MNLTKQDTYRRCSPFYEVALTRIDLYEEVIEKVVSTLKLEAKREWILIRISGSIIPNDDIVFGKSSSMWTIGRYLNKLHISPEKVQLGIGIAKVINIAQYNFLLLILKEENYDKHVTKKIKKSKLLYSSHHNYFY